MWDAATGAIVTKLKGYVRWITSVCFSPDGSKIASKSDDKIVRMWDAATGALVTTLEGHTGGVSSVCFSPDGSNFASGSVTVLCVC